MYSDARSCPVIVKSPRNPLADSIAIGIKASLRTRRKCNEADKKSRESMQILIPLQRQSRGDVSQVERALEFHATVFEPSIILLRCRVRHLCPHRHLRHLSRLNLRSFTLQVQLPREDFTVDTVYDW
jgi:hypothetical protein